MTNNKLTDVREHYLKIHPQWFAAVVSGAKRAELRRNDRPFRVGDALDLCEWDDEEAAFTGAFVGAIITHITELESVPGYVLLSFELQERRKADIAEPVSFDELNTAVAEVTGCNLHAWDPNIYKGHHPVPFMNYNSLARIVDKYRDK